MTRSRSPQTSLLATLALSLAAVSCGGGGGGGSNYAIQLEFPATTSNGDPNAITATQKAAFQSAATRIGQVITGGLGSMSKSSFAGHTCQKSNSDPGYPIDVDVKSLLIFVEVVPIDGLGGVLGQSGPCFTRKSNDLPVVGIMSFDSADLAQLETNHTLGEVILHEMLHVVGFGTIWTDKSVLSGAGGTTPTFTGAAAVTAYHAVGGPASTPVPVEGCSTTGTPGVGGTPGTCGTGTRDSHWTETVFQTELMTGWISTVNNPLSRVSVASLADLGYQVDLSKADAYTLPTSAQAARTSADVEPLHLGHDTLDRPPTAVSDE